MCSVVFWYVHVGGYHEQNAVRSVSGQNIWLYWKDYMQTGEELLPFLLSEGSNRALDYSKGSGDHQRAGCQTAGRVAWLGSCAWRFKPHVFC